MNPSEYITLAGQTDSNVADLANRMCRASTPECIDLLHASMGMVTEAGEVMDMVKKHIFYGRAIDTVNLREECCDLLLYIAIVCRRYGVSFEDLMQTNIDKLSRRYPGLKFTEDKALNRDVPNELKAFE